MSLDPTQAAIVAEMKQRELHMKRKQRATDALLFRERRFRAVILTIVGLATAAFAALIIFKILRKTVEQVGWSLPAIGFVILCVSLGVELGRLFLRTGMGKRVLGIRERQLRKRYSSELASGRRWSQYYYKGEDIAPYVSQVLYFLESDARFNTVDEALAFVKQNRRENRHLAKQAAAAFEQVSADGNLVVVASVSAEGVPSSRLMRYVRTDKPGVWYVSTTPESPKVSEFDAGRVAFVTPLTPDGGSINSNRVRITRAPFTLEQVAELFASQIPGYLDGISPEQQQRELVYEITMESARVDTWLDHDVVEFPTPE